MKRFDDKMSTLNFVSDPISDGITPFNERYDNSNPTKEVIRPKSEGIVPFKRFTATRKNVNEVIEVIQRGSVPTKLFLANARTDNFGRFEKN